MKAAKSFVGLSTGFILTLCFAVPVLAQMPPTNRLETGGNYQIGPPPTNMMFQITDNPTNAGDDNLVWSHSGRMLAVDRSDPNAMGPGGNKYIALLDVRNLGNVQTIGARSSAVTNPLFANITGWTWNDDRVLFGWQPQIGSPPSSGKVRLMSCTTTGDVSVVPFLTADPQANPTNHVYSPSVVFDPSVNKERLLFLVSSSTNNDQNGPNDITTQPAARINLYTVPFASGGVPNWADRVQLTAFNTNLSISSVKWCPELGTNYQPICNRLEILVVAQPWEGPQPPPPENNKIVIFNNVQSVIANPATAPISLSDSHFVVVETNLTMNSQVSWTFDGQYVMYGRNPPSDLYSMRADSSTNTAVKFEVPSSLSSGQKQWLCISPDGMKAAFTVNKQIYVIPLQFDNIAVTGAVVTNVLTDASYTAVDVAGGAINSNQTFSIVAPPSVDTNNFNGEFSGYARQFTVSGVSSQFDLETNALMTLHFSQSDIPDGASATNLAIYVYNPQGTNAGQTGTWDQLTSVIQTNSQTISTEVRHFSIYAIGRASAQPEGTPPFAPSTVSATKGHYQEQVLVSWSSSANATSYEVWRNTASDSGSATKLVESTSVSYGDTNAVVGTLYYYWVKAKNVAGVSSFSSSDTGYAMGVHNAYAADIDGDRKADPTAYYEGVNTWGVRLSGSDYFPKIELINYFGGPGYVGLAADFDGDLYGDPAVYQAATGTWLIKLSSASYQVLTLSDFLGDSARTAMAADFDGDAKADPAVYQAATGDWKIKLSSAGYATIPLLSFLGATGWIAFAADFDGDRLADPAVYSESNGYWIFRLSSIGYVEIALTQAFGGTGWQALGADFDGDAKADLTVFQPATGNWIIKLSSADYTEIPLNAFLGGLP